MNKTELLNKLLLEMNKDTSLPLHEANLVFGEGNADADVLFIGEAPGFYEDRDGRPFVGRAGKLLDKLIEDVGWKRNNVYITNIVKRRPPENRDPLPGEIAAYSPYLMKQIEIIDPKIIATLGRFAMNYFIPTAKISRDQGKILWWKNKLLIPLYHPAAALRSTRFSDDLRLNFAKLPIALDRFEEFLNDKNSRKPIDEKKGEEENEQKTLF